MNTSSRSSKNLIEDAAAVEKVSKRMQPLVDTLVIKEFAINIDEVRVFGDQAYAHGLYRFSGTPKDGGNPAEFNRKVLTIFKKQADGSLKILNDFFSYNGMGE